MKHKKRLAVLGFIFVVVLLLLVLLLLPEKPRTIQADVVALDQVFFWNRLGAVNPAGQIFALAHDVFPDGADESVLANSCAFTACVPGQVHLRAGKRPRPLVLRMNLDDRLQINFTNLLNPAPADAQQPATRSASVRAVGLQLVNNIADDGSNVGANASSLVAPGGTATYTLFAEREGEHVLYSGGAMTGGEGDGGSLSMGLFGAVNVQPTGARWLRSQVIQADMALGAAGATPGGHPILDYGAVYPAGHARAGLPIFDMLQNGKIVHSDLNAIISGPNNGRFPDGTYPPNPVYPDRDQPFREFTVIYHDEIAAVQAFPLFEDQVFSHTLQSVRDGFAHNYGTGGIGSEIIANRLAVGPMRDCTGCKYEEFFLASPTVGDPAQVVDVPANACVGDPLCRATEVLYPDDPSNVHHSYLQDHVKFRVLHAGPKEHHIHHQHTHQWLFSPDSDKSAYLDSQALGPGSSFTMEMVHNGSGNRNQAVGDSIFHCHFYPHFAQGMWSLWRVHDVFEDGSRMLSDGEIVQGTPIPALVPMQSLAMAPMPGAAVTIAPDPLLPNVGGQVQINGKFLREMTAADVATTGNPGYPFWVPSVAGHRPPHPPLETIDDGGLPRHVITGGETLSVQTRLDFTKELESVTALEIADPSPIEQVAMNAHAVRNHASYRPDGTPADFIFNGLPPVAGAPYADPCIDDDGNAVGVPRVYKAANIQLDVIFNKAGWHFPQQRIITLWGDVQDTFDGIRPPEPFFFRANTNDCIEFQHTNLVPNIYELDDFQVRTPTDILGQHIHLVKFDVLSSDGSANGWNYEDGNFSPDEVRERQRAIRAHNACLGDEVNGGDPRDGTFECPVAEAHPFFGAGPNGAFLGATTTVQRWYADDVLNLAGEDRTLRTVFTHDHFGPSTHQQAGLYSGLVVEPQGSTWRNPETGEALGGRTAVGPTGMQTADGGPTSWRADILTADPAASYREFMFEFADFSLAYQKDSHPNLPSGGGPVLPFPWEGVARLPSQGFDNPALAVNPPAKEEAALPVLVQKMQVCPGGVPLPCPEAISAEDVGTMVVNYRNEPVPLRVRDPQNGLQAPGDAGDLSLVFSSQVERADPAFNNQPGFYPPLTSGLQPGDPFTPLLRAYPGDRVQIRSMVGATEEGHNFSIAGIKWLFEPSDINSGWRSSQMLGISEHFEFICPLIGTAAQTGSVADLLYKPGSSVDDLWNGLWGLLRLNREVRSDLLTLPSNPTPGVDPLNTDDFNGPCPNTAPLRKFDVTAVSAQDALPGGTLVYNSRTVNGGPLQDPTAILYLRSADLDGTGQLLPGVPVEPLILRANAGDCIELTLRNKLPSNLPDLAGWATLPFVVENFNNNDVAPSNRVALHPQLLTFDLSKNSGLGFGIVEGPGPVQPGESFQYRWYAGHLRIENNLFVAEPVELGSANLVSSDPIKHPNKGAIGALIIEPLGATWVEETDSRASATVTKPGGASFREFVLQFQNFVNFRFGSDVELPSAQDEEGMIAATESFTAGQAIPNTADAEDAEDSGQKAFNYGSEPFWFRMGFAPDAPLGFTRRLDFTDVLSNSQVGGDPETPIFTAQAGTPVRFRVLHPGGNQRNNVFTIHGHIWEREPYQNGSTVLGSNPFSMWQGARMGVGPSEHFDALLKNGAGGKFKIRGDFLYRDFASFQFDGGLWGIFRVLP